MKAKQPTFLATLYSCVVMLGICLGFLYSNNAAAQITFQKVFGDSTNNYSYDVIELPDGYFVCGSTIYYDSGQVAAAGYLLKTDLHGNELWTQLYPFAGIALELHYIQPVSDGTYIITGVAGHGGGNDDLFLMNIKPNGSIIWHKIYGDAGLNNK